MGLQTVTIGGGCFWCLEAVYLEMKGIEKVVSGYAGGHTVNPTYQQVCSETTGHAEVTQITFDDTVTSFEDILKVFFVIHDPTTLNRQGNDIGESYRSIVLYHDEAQLEVSKKAIAEAQGLWDKPIVTELKPLTVFYPAEAYHQNYYARNPNQGYCMGVVAPKVAKFRSKFLEQVRR
jgi:peptide-methionine (S)-S-oxide reductase